MMSRHELEQLLRSLTERPKASDEEILKALAHTQHDLNIVKGAVDRGIPIQVVPQVECMAEQIRAYAQLEEIPHHKQIASTIASLLIVASLITDPTQQEWNLPAGFGNGTDIAVLSKDLFFALAASLSHILDVSIEEVEKRAAV